MDAPLNDQLSDLGISMEGEVKQQLLESARWARYISVVMMSCIGLLLIFIGVLLLKLLPYLPQLYALNYISSEARNGLMVLFGFFLLVLFTNAYLFAAGKRMQQAYREKHSGVFASSLKTWRIYFLFTAIISVLGMLFTVAKLYQKLN
ncbi:MAG TPA: hypothetical protein PKK69_09570 [Ferruginibacter sp.]|nr:hypothetical protein [Ferruginibacter sp.]